MTLIVVLFSITSFSQCDTKSEELGLFWTKEVVTGCTNKPNKLKIKVSDCSIKNDKYQIWTTAKWDGSYSTMNYELQLLIEIVEPSDKNKGLVTVYFIDYTDSWYKSLTHSCIDLEQTKPFKLKDGETQYLPYKEFDYKKK